MFIKMDKKTKEKGDREVEQEYFIPFQVYLNVTQKNDLPALQIRKVTTDPEIIKKLVTAAYYKQPVIVYPVFNNDIISISALLDKGILYRDASGKLFFNDF